MCSLNFYKCVERDRKRRAGYRIKHVTLAHEPKLTFCYGERGMQSMDKDKPTMLFIHGLCADKSSWYSVTGRLHSNQHCITFDLPGHGDSTWKDDDDLTTQGYVKRIHEFVKAIRLNKIVGGLHVVGHSWGAILAGEFAFKYGDVDKVTFLTLISLPTNTKLLSPFIYNILAKDTRNSGVPTLSSMRSDKSEKSQGLQMAIKEMGEDMNQRRDTSTDEATETLEEMKAEGELKISTPDDAKKIFSTVFNKNRCWTRNKWAWNSYFKLKQDQFPRYKRIWDGVQKEVFGSSCSTYRLGMWHTLGKTPVNLIWGKRHRAPN